MIFDGHVHQLPDTDPTETEEWLDSLEAIVDSKGKTRARFILSKLLAHKRSSGQLPSHSKHPVRQHHSPGAAAMVPW